MDAELILFDRLNIIRDVIHKYGEDKFYISYSGGKDSTVLHYLIDEALPGNRIPRVYADTGIEYNDVKAFVKELQAHDDRIEIIKPSVNIKQTLERDGYPFKSKEHSLVLSVYQNSGFTKTVNCYLDIDRQKYNCPKILRYQFSEEFNLKVSNKCCHRMKKDPFKKWEKDNKKTVVMTGMMSNEGGLRESIQNCMKVSEAWEEWYIRERNIKLCKLYYPPYSFKRTGCKGCPYALGLHRAAGSDVHANA